MYLVLIIRRVVDKRYQLRTHALRPQGIGDRGQVSRGRDPEVDVVILQVLDQHRNLFISHARTVGHGGQATFMLVGACVSNGKGERGDRRYKAARC